jgi:hypothetical protein
MTVTAEHAGHPRRGEKAEILPTQYIPYWRQRQLWENADKQEVICKLMILGRERSFFLACGQKSLSLQQNPNILATPLAAGVLPYLGL